MKDIVTISSPDYLIAGRARDYRCFRTSAEALEDDLPKINELAASDHIQMLEVDCRNTSNVSALALVNNVEFVRLNSENPLCLPDPGIENCNLKALSCCSRQFNSDSFPEIIWLHIHGIDFSKSTFRTAANLRRLTANDFAADDQMIGLAGAPSIVELELCKSTSLKQLNILSKLSELKSLSLSRLREVTSLAPIVEIEHLQNLSLERMKKIESYRPISELKSLESLMIVDSADIDFLSDAQIDSIRRFRVYGTKRARQVTA